MPNSILSAKDDYDRINPSILSPGELMAYKLLLPLYDKLSKGAREPGVPLTPDQVAWDAMVKRFNSPGVPGINGIPAPNPNPGRLPMPIIGVRG